MSPGLKDQYNLVPFPWTPALHGHPDKDWYDTQHKNNIEVVDMRDPRGYFRLSSHQFKKIESNDRIPLYRSKILLDTESWNAITSPEMIEKLKMANDDYNTVIRESVANLPEGQILRDTKNFPVDEFHTHDILIDVDPRIMLKLYLTKGHKTSITRDDIKPLVNCNDPLTSPDYFPTFVYMEYVNDDDTQIAIRSRFGIVYENWLELITTHAPKVTEDAVQKAEDYLHHQLQEKDMREDLAAVHVSDENPNIEAPPHKKTK